MAINVLVGIEKGALVKLGPPEGFLQEKGRFTWTTRFFRLCIEAVDSSEKKSVFLAYGKSSAEIGNGTASNRYLLNVEEKRTDSSQSLQLSQALGVPDDELHLDNVVQESDNRRGNDFGTLKLRFGCKFYRTLWQTCIFEAIRAHGYRDKPQEAVPLNIETSLEMHRLDEHEISSNVIFQKTNNPHELSSQIDFTELLVMSSCRSVNGRILCQRVAEFGFKFARYSHRYNNSNIEDYIVARKECWQPRKEAQHRPLFFGLHEIVDNIFRQPTMFGLTIGVLGHLSAVTCAIIRYCRENSKGPTKYSAGPRSDNTEEWVEAQDHLIAKLDSFLQEAVQKSKLIAKHGSISLLLLELTNARMSLVAIPSGKQLDLAKGVFQFVTGLAKSIAGMRLDPNLLSGLGRIATSSMGMLREGWAKDFCTRLSSISNLPDFLNFPVVNKDNVAFLKSLRSEVAHRFRENLFIQKSKFFDKPAGASVVEIGRWEFHAAFAVMLTQLVLRLKHENLKLIKGLRSKEFMERLPTFAEKDFLLRQKYLKTVEGDRFVLELLLERLDAHPFVNAEAFQRHLKDTHSRLAEIVHPFLKGEELIWLCEFHQKQQQSVAAARQIDTKDTRYVVSRIDSIVLASQGTKLTKKVVDMLCSYGVKQVTVKSVNDTAHRDYVLQTYANDNATDIELVSNVLHPPFPSEANNILTKELLETLHTDQAKHVKVRADEEIDSSFMSKFKGYEMDEGARVIAHSNALISDLIYGFFPTTAATSTISLQGTGARVRGLVDLACYGLNTSDFLNANPSFKLSSWAAKFMTAAANSQNGLLQEGLAQLQDFILNMVVTNAAQFEMGRIANIKSKSEIDGIDAQIAAAEIDRRLESLESTKEKLGKAEQYIRLFIDLVKLIPGIIRLDIEPNPEDQNPDNPKPDDPKPSNLFEIMEVPKLDTTDKLKLVEDISHKGELIWKADEVLNESAIEKLRQAGIEKVVVQDKNNVHGDMVLKHFGKLVVLKLHEDIKLGDDQNANPLKADQILDQTVKNAELLKADQILDQTVISKLRKAGRESVSVKSDNAAPETNIDLRFFGTSTDEANVVAEAGVKLTWDLFCNLCGTGFKTVTLVRVGEVQIAQVFQDAVTLSADSVSPPGFLLLKFLKEFLPKIVQILSANITEQVDHFQAIKLLPIEDQIEEFNNRALKNIANYSELATEIQTFLKFMINGPFAKLCFNPLFEVPKELASVVDSIKDAALTELKKLADNELVVAGKEVIGQIGEVLSNIGIKSIFNALGGLLSDYNSKKQAEQEPFRVREVAVFCIAFIAAATGSVELQLFLGAQRIKETHPSVKAVLNATDPSDQSYNPAIFEQLLRFWCPADVSSNCLHMFCLSGQSVLQVPPQEIFFENDAMIQQYIRKKFEEAENLRIELERDPDSMIVEKQLKMVKLRKAQKEIKQLAANVSDVGAKLNIVVDYLADMQDQLGRMDAKLSGIQAGIDDLRKDMFTLTGKPLMSIIEQCTKDQIVVLNRSSVEEVYVQSKAQKQYYAFNRGDWTRSEAATQDAAQKTPEIVAQHTPEFVETAFQKFMDPELKHEEDAKEEANPERKSEIIQPKNVFLLAGKAGSGKSTMLNRLKRYVLTDYARARAKQGWTVVLLSASLPSLKNPKTDLFREAAMQTFGAEFRELHVDLLREKCRNCAVSENGSVVDGVEIVFFLDAWDELRPEFQDNLWATNNLERYRPKPQSESSIARCRRFPKVFFTCREETIMQFENSSKSSMSGMNSTVISCIKYFFPREISDSDKDEDHECVNFFEDWRIQDFPLDGRRKYLNQYVAHNLRKEFFKQVDFIPVANDLMPENTEQKTSKSSQLKERLKTKDFVSTLQTSGATLEGKVLAVDAKHPPWRAKTKLTSELIEAMKKAEVKRVTVFGTEEEIDVDNAHSKVLAKDVEYPDRTAVVDGIEKGTTLKHEHILKMQSAGSHGVEKIYVQGDDFADACIDVCSFFMGSPTAKLDDVQKIFEKLYPKRDRNDGGLDRIGFVSALFVACFCHKCDETQQQKYYKNFVVDQTEAFGLERLWMPQKYDVAFNEMAELSELIKTPFMVQVFSRILPKLHQMKISYGFAEAKKHMQHVDPDFGPLWASYIIPNVTDQHFFDLAKYSASDENTKTTGLGIFKQFFRMLITSVRKGNVTKTWTGTTSDAKLLELAQILSPEERDMFQKFLGQCMENQMAVFDTLNVKISNGKFFVGTEANKNEIQERTLKIISLLKLVQNDKEQLWRLLSADDEVFEKKLFENECREMEEKGNEIRENLWQKIVSIVRCPPLLRGMIYRVFCQHVVEENVGRKRGNAIESDVLLEAIHYSRNLALHLSTNSLSKLTRTNRSKLFADAHDSDKFFRDDDLFSAARRTAPVKSGSEVSFLHKTLQEYFVAECISSQVLEAFQVEQITPVQLTEWLRECDGVEWYQVASNTPNSPMSPRNVGVNDTQMPGSPLVRKFQPNPEIIRPPKSSSNSISQDRLNRLFDALERGPLNHYLFTDDQEKVSVLDFFLDIMFMNEDFVEHLRAVVALCAKVKKEASFNARDFTILSRNLKSIVTQRIGRLNGRCLMHEVLLQNNFSVFDFCIEVHDNLQDEFDKESILTVLDYPQKDGDCGLPPVYFALTRPGCLLLDKIAPKKQLWTQHASGNFLVCPVSTCQYQAPPEDRDRVSECPICPPSSLSQDSKATKPQPLILHRSYCNIEDQKLKDQLKEAGLLDQMRYQQNLSDRGFLHNKSSDGPKLTKSVSVAAAQHVLVSYETEEGVLIRELLVNAANGKSKSQKGYNMDEMKQFIQRNKGLFDKSNGPIFDSFPELHALGRRDLNHVVQLILDQDTSPQSSDDTKSAKEPMTIDNSIYVASKHDDYKLVRAFLTKEPSLLNSRDQDNNTPLMKATIWDAKEAVRTLLYWKADVNAQKDK